MMLKTFALAFVVLLVSARPAFGQRDSPVWNSFLASFSLYDGKDKVEFDLTYCKGGGPIEHTQHQMYVIGYLEDDEAAILKLAADKSLSGKSGDKSLLDAFTSEGLATILDVQLAEAISPKAEEGKVRRNWGSTFPFSFSLDNKTLFKSLSGLKHFDPKQADESGGALYFKDKFKMLLFVPTNDSRYATKVPADLRAKRDFAHVMDAETALLYFKPLPYRFEFRSLKDGETVLVDID